jgi:hypothetical protein
MDDSSPFQRPSPRSPDALLDSNTVAEAADIPRPSEGVLQNELAAQVRLKDRQDFGTLPRNLLEAVLLIQAMEREGRRVERSQEAMMQFLKEQQGGDVISADLLAATALMMAAIPVRREKNKGWWDFAGIRNALRRWIRKVKAIFKGKT